MMVGGTVHPSTGDGWTGGKSEDKSEAEGKESLYPWKTQEDWRESSSGGKWKNRQYEGCNAKTLRSSERYDLTQQERLSGFAVVAMECLTNEWICRITAGTRRS